MENNVDNNAANTENEKDLKAEPEEKPEGAQETAPEEEGSDSNAPGKITSLDDFPDEGSMEELMDLYEESFKQFAEGEVVIGKIISVDKDHVLVDIGYKSEGQIPIREFKDADGNTSTAVGDSVEVMIEWWDEENEVVVLSKEKAEKVKVWEAIKVAYDADETVDGTIVSRVKGGFSVDIGVNAFLPGSQADLRPIRNMDELVGKSFSFKILKYNRKRSNIVLSRRVLLEEEREEKRAATLASIHEGKVVDGVVKNITEYGVFVDLGGVDGLLHITDISWGRVKHPSEMFSVGDEITVKILNLDLERERVSLGMKQLSEDPWNTAAEKYPVDSKIKGRVVSLTDYGAFVELEEGIEGLIHVSEMSWTRKIRHPSKVVSVNDEVDAVVLDIKPDARRISLGMKQAVPNPWDVISDKYPVGTTIEGKIKNITDFGVFVELEEGIEGLIHVSEISKEKIKTPVGMFEVGDMVTARVMNINSEERRIGLSIKRLDMEDDQSILADYVNTMKESNSTEFGDILREGLQEKLNGE
ncbi:MAG: 30S ribosomal protein S1 [Desulfosarcinaceae bacterium]